MNEAEKLLKILMSRAGEISWAIRDAGKDMPSDFEQLTPEFYEAIKAAENYFYSNKERR